MSKPVLDDFFDAWRTYRKVVAANYMFHEDIGTELNRLLRARFEGRPIAWLDLGCGDAATLAPVLAGLTLSLYRGVDLSETALALAANHLQSLACPAELAHEDFLNALSEDGAAYDVIYTSFALHHLSTERKAEFFARAAQRLKSDGCLLLVDVMREADENLETYRQRYCDWLRGAWDALDADEKTAVCDHLVNNDLPEPCSLLQDQAAAAGLGNVVAVARHGWHRALCFSRA